MLVDEVKWCSFDNWYDLFKKVTFKSVILPIPNDVLDYLRSDGSLVLPRECDSDDDEDEDDDNETARPSFPEFSSAIEDAIRRLGGAVFCKLNWSSPRDATWMGLANSLRCDAVSQVWLLLKSSEFVVHDLTQPFKGCDDADGRLPADYVLVLREWNAEMNPGAEFRCLVKSKRLLAVEQRDKSNYYPHMKDERESILRDIRSFFNEHVRDKLAVGNVVMDVARPSKDVVQLVDFNPFGATTDVGLFDWDDLLVRDSAQTAAEFRCVNSEAEVQSNGLRQYSLPSDIVDLAAGTDPHKLVDFLQLQTDMQKAAEKP